MSELTICNFCQMQAIRRKAKAQGKRVDIHPAPWHTFEKGVDVLVDRKKIVWFAELPDKCCC